MQELIKKITDSAGISEEQATKAIESVKDFVKEKFPMLEGAVENLFSQKSEAAEDPADGAKEESVLDKISNVIPGEAGQKVEDFAKNAAQQAEDAFGNVKDKLSGLFGGNK